MADPVTLALAAAGVAATTAVAGGFAAKGASDFNADVAENNAKLTRQRAAAQGAARARQTRQALARKRASAAARGVEFSGSALDVAAEEAIESELEQRFIAHRGSVQAKAQESQAQLQRKQGRFKLGASVAQAGGTLLSGASEAGQLSAARGTASTGTT